MLSVTKKQEIEKVLNNSDVYIYISPHPMEIVINISGYSFERLQMVNQIIVKYDCIMTISALEKVAIAKIKGIK